MIAMFKYVLRSSHGINVIIHTQEELNNFYLKMRIMWHYFGQPTLPQCNGRDVWTIIAHNLWIIINKKNKDICKLVDNEIFPNSVFYTNLVLSGSKNYNNKNSITDWQRELHDEGDLITYIQEKVTLIGLGNFEKGVKKFITMKNPTIEIFITD
jgi:hypothetical protein